MPHEPAPQPLPDWLAAARDHLIQRQGMALGAVLFAAWYEFDHRRHFCYVIPTLFTDAEHVMFRLTADPGSSRAGPAAELPVAPQRLPTAGDVPLLAALRDHGPLTRKAVAARLGQARSGTPNGAFGRHWLRCKGAGWTEEGPDGWRLSESGRIVLAAALAGRPRAG